MLITKSISKACRALLEWTQKDLAEAAQVGLRTIIDFEGGKRTPISATLQALEAAFVRGGLVFTSDGGILPPRKETSDA